MSQAAVLQDFNGLDAVTVVEREPPEPGPGEVRVRMHAVAVQPVEAIIASGALPMAKPVPLILGGNGAGQVETDGTKFKAGDRVAVGGFMLGLGADGLYAEHAIVPEQDLHLIPDGIDYEIAAGVGTAFPTAALALEASGLQAGETALILGATGGVGSAAVQVAKAMGATVIATSRTAEGCRYASDLGADATVQLGNGSLKDAVAAIAEQGVNVVIDPVGGPLTGQAVGTLGPGGRQVVLGYIAGVETTVTVTDLVMTGGKLIGFSLWGPPVERVREVEAESLAALGSGSLRVVVGGRFPLSGVAAAHAALGSSDTLGRVMLVP